MTTHGVYMKYGRPDLSSDRVDWSMFRTQGGLIRRSPLGPSYTPTLTSWESSNIWLNWNSPFNCTSLLTCEAGGCMHTPGAPEPVRDVLGTPEAFWGFFPISLSGFTECLQESHRET